jgi:hypothetical protein
MFRALLAQLQEVLRNGTWYTASGCQLAGENRPVSGRSVRTRPLHNIHTTTVTKHNTPIHNILSTAPQLSISQKKLGTLPEDANVMPKHVRSTIHN